MDPANSREALREATLDVDEGADLLMVKPALAYLDIITKIRDEFDLPLAAHALAALTAPVKAAEPMMRPVTEAARAPSPMSWTTKREAKGMMMERPRLRRKVKA